MPSEPDLRHLVLVRHARAEAFASSDQERMLSGSGRADARRLASWLADRIEAPGRALVSPVARTRQTWDALAEQPGWRLEPEYDDLVYAGDTATLIDELGRTPETIRVVLLLGHNPAMAYLAQILSDGEGDTTAEVSMVAGFPPASAAVLALAGPWSDLAPGGARLRSFRPGSADR
ncbi:MAG: SixA phosphatase family protein [Nocardioides sp.]